MPALSRAVVLLSAHGRAVPKFKAASLLPLAEHFPLGGSARLRVFLELTKGFTVRGARLELSAYEGISKARAEKPVPVHAPIKIAPEALDTAV
ncbi:MAG TPA: hypothetical protein VF664_06975 [Cystobacter sp.]